MNKYMLYKKIFNKNKGWATDFHIKQFKVVASAHLKKEEYDNESLKELENYIDHFGYQVFYDTVYMLMCQKQKAEIDFELQRVLSIHLKTEANKKVIKYFSSTIHSGAVASITKSQYKHLNIEEFRHCLNTNIFYLSSNLYKTIRIKLQILFKKLFK